jgi:molybdopterin-containing oxidoreductase family membrane subunit
MTGLGFSWWLGLAQAGTLISALLLLFRQPWRREVHHAAEGMALIAGSLALVHACVDLGRPWMFGAMLPFPDRRGIEPTYDAPLTWLSVSLVTFAVVSALFFYVGLIPELAARRDATRSRFYGVLALGWRGSGQHWRHWKHGHRVLAALAVVSAVCVQGFDLRVVASALLAGFAVVALVTRRQLDALGQLVLASGVAVGCTYLIESGLKPPGGPLIWAMLACAVVAPLVLAIPRARTRSPVMMIVCVLACAGAWLGVFTR